MSNTLHAISSSFILNMEKSTNYGTLNFVTFSIPLLNPSSYVQTFPSASYYLKNPIPLLFPTFSDFCWISPANLHSTIAPYSHIIKLWGVLQPQPSIKLSHPWYLTTDFNTEWALGWMKNEKFKEVICQVHLFYKFFLTLSVISCAFHKMHN
jgi:hypothetical protein